MIIDLWRLIIEWLFVFVNFLIYLFPLFSLLGCKDNNEICFRYRSLDYNFPIPVANNTILSTFSSDIKNNIDEYKALIHVPEWIKKRIISCIQAFGDSDIIFN